MAAQSARLSLPTLAAFVLLTTTATIAGAAEPPAQTLTPKSIQKLATPVYGLAWLDPSTLLLASDGVVTYRLDGKPASTLIAHSAVPAGLPSVDGVATDGKTVAAFTVMDHSQFVLRVPDRKRILARTSARFDVLSLAVSGDRLYVLGSPVARHGVDNASGVAVWVGKLDAGWDELAPLHTVTSPAAKRVFQDATFPHAGSLAVDPQGDVYVYTSAEPGIFRYDAKGALKGTWGTSQQDLVIARMHDLNFRYAADPEGRYRDLINTQRTVDQLVVTEDGPAWIVRTVRDNRVHWSLEYPGAQTVRARYALGIDREGPYGHLRCSALSRQLACSFSKPDGSSKSYHLATWSLPTLSSARR